MSKDEREQILQELGSIKGQMKTGFDAVHDRLDKLNGSVAKHEKRLNTIDVDHAERRGREEAEEENKQKWSPLKTRVLYLLISLAVGGAATILVLLLKNAGILNL